MAISFQQSNVQKRLFIRSNQQIVSYILCLTICLLLLIIDCKFHVLGALRNSVNYLSSPIQYLVDYPVKMASSIQVLFSTKKSLIDENIRLRHQQSLLETKLQKLLAIRNENNQLKALLSASSAANEHAEAAEILAVETSNSRNLLILNKGTRDGVFVGQPVLDAKGVMGQIIDVGTQTSTVLLVSDSKSAVPVRNNRTGERTILIGTNHLNELSLINLPKSSSIEKGDLLETSGLGGHYPDGYPVGRVEGIEQQPGEDFIKVNVSPIAQLNSTRLVLLIWPGSDDTELEGEIHQRLKKFLDYPFP